MYLAGKSVECVAAKFHCSRQSMWRVLQRRGVRMRPQKRFGESNVFFRHGEGYGPEQIAARNAVSRAVRDGELVRQPCEKCGSTARAKDGRSLVHAHHDDYSKPLIVRWMCQRCHYRHHEETVRLL